MVEYLYNKPYKGNIYINDEMKAAIDRYYEQYGAKQENIMNEKTYKTLTAAGAGNIAIGIVMLVTGVTCGVLAIINGAKMLKRKSDIIF